MKILTGIMVRRGTLMPIKQRPFIKREKREKISSPISPKTERKKSDPLMCPPSRIQEKMGGGKEGERA